MHAGVSTACQAPVEATLLLPLETQQGMKPLGAHPAGLHFYAMYLVHKPL